MGARGAVVKIGLVGGLGYIGYNLYQSIQSDGNPAPSPPPTGTGPNVDVSVGLTASPNPVIHGYVCFLKGSATLKVPATVKNVKTKWLYSWSGLQQLFNIINQPTGTQVSDTVSASAGSTLPITFHATAAWTGQVAAGRIVKQVSGTSLGSAEVMVTVISG